MANDIIKKHNFELAKNSIKSLALQIPPSVSLKSFPTNGSFWGFTSHNVTGKEINDKLVEPLQIKLIDQNNHIRNLYNVADEVYKALDLLDKEYVSGIVGTAEAAALASDQALAASKKAQKASNQALDASSQALDATKKATIAQNDIKNTIAALQQTVTILKTFKEKVSQELEALSSIGERFTPIENKISDIEQTGKTFKTSISLIDSLQKYRTLLESYQHLGDIDAIWSDVETLKKEYFDLHQNLSSFIEATNSEQEKIKETIHQMEIENNLVRQQYDKRMKIAYWIGGCAVGLTIVNYVLQFIGIL